MSRPTVYIETYGCQMNVSDSELMYGRLAAHGYDPVDGPEGADVCEVACVDQVHVERARRALPADATLRTLAETFRALGDPTRLRIVAALAAGGVGELCVCDLATLVGVSPSAVSHSLRTLRELRLVQYRKAGKIAYYRLDGAHATRLVADGVEHVEAGPLLASEGAPVTRRP